MLLIKLDNLIEGTILKRPSAFIKSPYVADIQCSNTDEIYLGHTASLGCCGLAEVNSSVLISENKESKTKPKNQAGLKCTHTVFLSVVKHGTNENIIGIHPKLAEQLVESALTKNCLSSLLNIKKFRKETTIFIKDKVDSRFDFTGIDSNGIPFIMEVKNVPLADYEDLDKKDRGKHDFSDRDYNSKVAYFPDGYRKKSEDTVSPRALKHIRELTLIKTSDPKIRCIMCYVIQRIDVNRFQPSIVDPQYREAFKTAFKVGVEIITLVVSWNKKGEAYFVRDNLPIVHDDI